MWKLKANAARRDKLRRLRLVSGGVALRVLQWFRDLCCSALWSPRAWCPSSVVWCPDAWLRDARQKIREMRENLGWPVLLLSKCQLWQKVWRISVGNRTNWTGNGECENIVETKSRSRCDGDKSEGLPGPPGSNGGDVMLHVSTCYLLHVLVTF